MKDLYNILGLSKTASTSEIKKKYRTLAKKLHPDRNPDDEKVSKRFKEVSAAYSVLSDKDQRARYDRGEIDASGAERGPFGGGGFRGFEEAFKGARQGRGQGRAAFRFEGAGADIFSELFGFGRGGNSQGKRKARRSPLKGKDAEYSLTIPFLDAVKGTRSKVKLRNGKTLNVTIPAGVKEGQRIRLAKQGQKGFAGGPAGDAMIEIKIKPHPYFDRSGDDILVEVPITLDEAVLGAKISVPTISGAVKVKVPKGSSSGRKLRLKGKGVKTGKKSGDQYVILKIVVPEKSNPELEGFLKEWRRKHGYNARDSFDKD